MGSGLAPSSAKRKERRPGRRQRQVALPAGASRPARRVPAAMSCLRAASAPSARGAPEERLRHALACSALLQSFPGPPGRVVQLRARVDGSEVLRAENEAIEPALAVLSLLLAWGFASLVGIQLPCYDEGYRLPQPRHDIRSSHHAREPQRPSASVLPPPQRAARSGEFVSAAPQPFSGPAPAWDAEARLTSCVLSAQRAALPAALRGPSVEHPLSVGLAATWPCTLHTPSRCLRRQNRLTVTVTLLGRLVSACRVCG